MTGSCALMTTTDWWWGLLVGFKLLHSVIQMTSLGNSNCSVIVTVLYCNYSPLLGYWAMCKFYTVYTLFSMFIYCDWFNCSLDLLWLILHGIRAIAGTRSLFYRCFYKKIWVNLIKNYKKFWHERSQGHSLLCMQSLKILPIPLQKLEFPHKSWIW